MPSLVWVSSCFKITRNYYPISCQFKTCARSSVIYWIFVICWKYHMHNTRNCKKTFQNCFAHVLLRISDMSCYLCCTDLEITFAWELHSRLSPTLTFHTDQHEGQQTDEHEGHQTDQHEMLPDRRTWSTSVTQPPMYCTVCMLCLRSHFERLSFNIREMSDFFPPKCAFFLAKMPWHQRDF